MAIALRSMVLAAVMVTGASSLSAAELTPVGRWRTLDEDTGADTGLIEITQAGETLEGRVVKMVMKEGEPSDPVCVKCAGAQKGQHILGLTILKGFKRDGELWDNGTILDPWSGYLYSSQLRLDESGNKLFVRGYLGIPLLGQTQVWLRAK